MCGREMWFGTLCLLISLILIVRANGQFQIPDPVIQALSPRGLKLSIPDKNGIKSFAFHGQANKPMVGREEGTFAKEVTKSVDGHWTYQDKSARLKIGDTIYYWLKVDHLNGTHKTTYFADNLNFVVKELVPEPPPSLNGTTTTTRPPTTIKPIPKPPTPGVKSAPTTTENPNCKNTPTMVNGKRSCQGKLIYQDLFSEFQEKRWQPEVKFAAEPDYEFVIYQNNKENLYVDNYVLHIMPTLTEDRYGSGFVTQHQGLDLGDSCTGILGSQECVQKPKAWLILPPVISAQITTRDHFSFLYGIVEIRARLPKGDWIYPQLFLKSTNEDYGPGFQSGLIKIASIAGNVAVSKQLLGGVVLGQSTMARNRGLKSIRSDKVWNNDFHIFRLEWRPDSIIVSVDGKIYGNIYPPDGGFTKDEHDLGIDPEAAKRWRKGTIMSPFDKEMYLCFGVGVGGLTFADRTDGSKPWANDDPKAQLHFYRAQENWTKTWSDESDLVIDSVKVWAL